jgi:cold shock CspA family protein
MPTGKLIRLVHLSQQRHLPNTRLVPDHNDKGYGIIEDAQGRAVFFSHDVVENSFGFDDLRKGQQLEYTLENAPYLRASCVRVAAAVATASPTLALRPAA